MTSASRSIPRSKFFSAPKYPNRGAWTGDGGSGISCIAISYAIVE